MDTKVGSSTTSTSSVSETSRAVSLVGPSALLPAHASNSIKQAIASRLIIRQAL
jgi:hypothetical protein